MLKCDVLIIGGGATGTSILRDLSMRGIKTCLIERNVISSGATSHSHQNLVSGMRYVVKDPKVARECAQENEILSKIAPNIIGSIKNYFVGFKSDKYVDLALESAETLGVKFKLVKPAIAFKEIPALNRDIDIIVETNDRNIDAREFCRLNCESALKRHATLLEHTVVKSIERKAGVYLIYTNRALIRADKVVNATGTWANEIANKVGVNLPLLYSQGTIIILKALSSRGLQRLSQPADAAAYIVHKGLAWLGTTSTTINTPDEASPEPWADEYLKENFSIILPDIVHQHTLGVFVGVRPLLKSNETQDGRKQSRDFRIIEKPTGIFHIIGGKLTIARLMAEKVADRICEEMGINTKCITAKLPLGE